MSDFKETVDNTTILDEDDFMEVKAEVTNLAGRWQDLGGSLGIRPSTMNTIKAANAQFPNQCLAETLTEWLNKNYKVEKHGKPTWRKLVEAVEDRSGGNNRDLAEKIALKHPAEGLTQPSPQPSPRQPDQPTSSPSPSPPSNGATSTDRANWFPEQDRQRVSVDGGNKKKIVFERFDALKPDKKMKDVKLSFTTVKPQSSEQQRKYDTYDMKCFPHGVALIINNEEFVRQADREGTGIDEKNLIQTFRYLGYTVEVHRDRTASQIKDIFDEVSRRKDHSKYDSFICCILSHGKEGQIYGSDSEIVEFSEIVGKLNGESCKGLASKPKLFFVQACRGKGRDRGTRVASDSAEPRIESDSDPISIPDDADFYFGYATPSGKVAWRDLDHGSWYVSELCRSLCSRATYADLNHMIQDVHHKVGTDYKNEGYKQAPEMTSRLRKDIYFFG